MHDSGNNNVPFLLSLNINTMNTGYWYPASIAGFDRLASGFFTGLDRLLFAILPGWLPSQIFHIAMIAGGGWSIYRLALDRLRLPETSALVSGVVHATAMTNFQMGLVSVALLPLFIWVLGRAIDSRAWWRWLPPCGTAIALGVSSQIHVLLPFVPALIVLWFIVVEPARRIADWLLIAAACALTFAVYATTIVALVANAPLSYRGIALLAAVTESGGRLDLLSPLPRWARPMDLGVFVLSAVAFAAAIRRRQLLYPRLAVLLCVVWLLPTLADVAKLAIVPFLPTISGYRLDRFAIYDGPFLGIAAGAALALLRDDAGPRWRGRLLSHRTVALIAVLLLVFVQSVRFKLHHAYEWVQQGNYVQNFRSPTIRSLADRHRGESEWFRVASVNMPTNVLAAYGFETIDGYVNIYSRQFREFWERVVAGKIAQEGPLGSVSEIRLFHDKEMPAVEFPALFNLSMLSLANVRYILARNELRHRDLSLVRGPSAPWATLPLMERVRIRLRENFTGSDWIYIYENRTVLPRAFFATPESFPDSATLLAALSSRTAAELRERALVLARDMSAIAPGTGEVRKLSRAPDRIELDVTTAQGHALLTVTENFSPFWRCDVDGEPCRLLPVYHTFMGVIVPHNSQRVVLTYKPPQRLF
jgi:hypothetical protein